MRSIKSDTLQFKMILNFEIYVISFLLKKFDLFFRGMLKHQRRFSISVIHTLILIIWKEVKQSVMNHSAVGVSMEKQV